MEDRSREDRRAGAMPARSPFPPVPAAVSLMSGGYRNGIRAATPLQERLEQCSIPVPWSGCWQWLGPVDGKGYGMFQEWNGGEPKTRRAHRASYEFHCGEIPKGLVIDHLCRNHGCINPEHLELVTPHENWRRGEQTAVLMQRNKTHCPQGHPLVPRGKRGTRWCPICANARRRELYGQRTRR